MNETKGYNAKKGRGRTLGIAIVVVVVAAVLIGAVVMGTRANPASAASEPATITLERTELQQVVTTTGKLQSRDTRKVTSDSGYKIAEIYVEVGSEVAEGDALCRLDAPGGEELVTSPIAGTVTDMQAEIGQAAGGTAAGMSAMDTAGAAGAAATSSGGALFTVEDTHNLEIVAAVPEYDMVLLNNGISADINSDALVDEIWTGTLRSISPAATDTNSNFTVVVELTSEPGKLAIGMSAKVNLIVESKTDVYAVPYDSLTTNEAGETVVYEYLGAGTESDSAGNTDADRREIPVSTGMETDYYVEILSDELEEGMVILTDPEGNNENTGSSGMGFMMGGG